MPSRDIDIPQTMSVKHLAVYRLLPLALGAAVVFAILGCGAGEPQQSSSSSATRQQIGENHVGPYKIVTTCAMVTDMVAAIAGKHAAVEGLMGEGTDPHLYKPTGSDVKKLRDADAIFYSGLMLEGRMADTFTQISRGGKAVFAVTEELQQDYLREPPEFAGHWDPHVWMDVAAWSKCAGFVCRALSEFDPAHAKDYSQNLSVYQAELAKLDEYARKVIASIPEQQRLLVTAHDAFGYFSRAYNIPVHAVQGITTESEAGVNDVNELVKLIVDRKLRAIFIESSVSPKNIQAIIEGARQRGWEVDGQNELFSDAMGAPGTYEGTYVGMIDHNATVIARALGGEAPEKGLNGKLGGK